MAVYSITDGVTTLDLDAGYVDILDYAQGTAELEQRSSSSLFDGAQVQSIYRPITESFELLITGTQANILATLRTLAGLLETAKNRQRTGAGPRVYLYCNLAGETLKRSEILAGKPQTERIPNQLWRGSVETQLTITRVHYWEKVTEDELPLTASGQGTPATGGRTFTNDGVNNWFAVAGSQINGDLPAPVRLNLQNTSGSSINYRNYWVGANYSSSPGAFVHYIQGETGQAVSSGAGYSGGQFTSLAYGTTEPILYTAYWRVPTATMAAAGRYCRFVVRLGLGIAVIRARVTVLDYFALNVLWRSKDFSVVDGLNDLGGVPIPPGAFLANYAQVCIGLSFWGATAGAVAVDYMNMIGPDYVRRVDQPAMLIANNDFVEFDEIEGAFYSIEAGLKHPILFPSGQPLTVTPGKDHRFYALVMPATVTHTMKARLFYRARYLFA